jgi:hypothetical protein
MLRRPHVLRPCVPACHWPTPHVLVARLGTWPGAVLSRVWRGRARDEEALRLFSAAGEGRLDEVKALLSGGADANHAVLVDGAQTALTSLARAADAGHLDVVAALLEAGADVNDADAEGVTALAWAAINGHAAVVKALLEADASVDDRDTGVEFLTFFAKSFGFDAVTETPHARSYPIAQCGCQIVVCMDVWCMYVCMYVYMYVCMYVCMYVFLYFCMCMDGWMYVYM